MTSADILLTLGRANLAAAAAILAVVILRKPARRAFGARIAYGLWALVLIAAAASLLPPQREAPVRARSPQAVQAAQPATPQPTIATPASAASTPVDLAPLILALWLTGIAASIAWLCLRQRAFLAEAREGRAGPAVAGFLRPQVILPADFHARFTPDERQMVLAHEWMHLARQDPRINAAVALVQCLCWFNPLVHLAAHLMRIDQELACDAAVQAGYPGARRTYAGALVKSQLAHTPLPLGCYWPAGSEHPLNERIAMLKANAPGRIRWLLGGALVAGLAAAAGFGAWIAQPKAPAKVIASAAAPETASALPAEWIVPVQFRGEWHERSENCADVTDPTRLVIAADHLRFPRGAGPVQASSTHGLQLTVVADIATRGESLQRTFGFMLSPEQDTLTAIGDGIEMVREKCRQVMAAAPIDTGPPPPPTRRMPPELSPVRIVENAPVIRRAAGPASLVAEAVATPPRNSAVVPARNVRRPTSLPSPQTARSQAAAQVILVPAGTVRPAINGNYYFSLAPIEVDVGGSGATLTLRITLELARESAIGIDRYGPRLTDAYVEALSKLRRDQVEDNPRLSQFLKDQLLGVSNGVIKPGKVAAVLIEDLELDLPA